MKNKISLKKLPHLILRSNKLLFFISLVSILLLALGIPSLKKDISHRIWFKKGDPFLNKYEYFTNTYGNDDLLIIILENENDVFTPTYSKELFLLTEKLESVPSVLRADSIANTLFSENKSNHITFNQFFPDTESLNQEFLDKRKKKINKISESINFYLSPDFKTSVIYLYLKKSDPPDYEKTINKSKEIVQKIISKETIFFMTGNSILAEAYKKAPVKDMKIILPLALFLLIILLYFIFKNLAGILIPLFHLFFSLIALMGVQGHLNITINSVTSMAPLIIMAISILDSIHLLTTFYQSKIKKGTLRSLLYSLKINIFPTFLTSFTTAIGFFALSTSKISPVSNLGTLCGIGVILAWPLTFCLIPFILLKLSKNSKPSKLIPFRANIFLYLIKNNQKKVLFFSTLITFLGIILAFQNEVNSDFKNYFSKSTPFRKANEKLEKSIGGSSTLNLIIRHEDIRTPHFLKRLDKFINELEKVKGVTKVLSILDIIKNARKLLFENNNSYFSIPPTKKQVKEVLFFYQLNELEGKELYRWAKRDFSELRINLFWKEFSSKEIKRGMEQIEFLIKKYNLNGNLTGKALFMRGLDTYILKTFILSIGLAICGLTLLMTVLFKSLKVGLFAMIPNIIPLILGVAALSLFNKGLDVSAVLIGSISLGISIDDTIFFMTHYYRKNKVFKSSFEAVEKTLKETGHTLYLTTMILALILGLFSFASFGPNKIFGLMTSFTLILAFLFDLTLLPILLLKEK